MFGRLADLVFPPKCLNCDRRGVVLCEGCKQWLPYLPPDVCLRCASTRSGSAPCRACRRLSATVTSVRAAFVYRGAARRAVLTLKFRSGLYVAPLMGELLCAALVQRPIDVDVVVPVPLAVTRRRERGFNQAALLAQSVAAHLDRPLLNTCLKRDERPRQSGLNASERAANIVGAFRCAQGAAVRGRRVLLVDDVVTTGATVSACADTLAEAGAGRIGVLAFARDL